MFYLLISPLNSALGYVSLYTENYPSFALTGCDPIEAEMSIDLPSEGFYEDSVIRIIPKYGCWNSLSLQGDYVVAAGIFIENRLLNFWTNKLDNFIATEWYKLHRGKTPKLDWFPNKYNFPHLKIIQ